MSLLKSLGKNPLGKRLERIKQSPYYKNNAFQNLYLGGNSGYDAHFKTIRENLL